MMIYKPYVSSKNRFIKIGETVQFVLNSLVWEGVGSVIGDDLYSFKVKWAFLAPKIKPKEGAYRVNR